MLALICCASCKIPSLFTLRRAQATATLRRAQATATPYFLGSHSTIQRFVQEWRRHLLCKRAAIEMGVNDVLCGPKVRLSPEAARCATLICRAWRWPSE